ncbi:MAG: hypothetical protein U0165_05800 [Polyangiaceae bacterium]
MRDPRVKPTPAAARTAWLIRRSTGTTSRFQGGPVIPDVDPRTFDLPNPDEPRHGRVTDLDIDVDIDFDAGLPAEPPQEEEHVDTWRAPPAGDEQPFQHALLRPKAVSCPPPMAFDELDSFDSPLALAGERPTLPPLAPPPEAETEASAPARPSMSREERLAEEMKARYAVGDFSGALTSAESLLALSPSHRDAQKHADSCREVLTQMYTARLGSLIHVPRVVMSPDKVRWLSLDHRSGFLLACIDGYSTVEEILDVCGMPVLDALRMMTELQDQKVIEVSVR